MRPLCWGHLNKGKKMVTQEVTTTNLADFGHRERVLLQGILSAWNDKGLPEGFYSEGVHPMFNRNSGCVFLTNDEYQAAMMNGDVLEIWHNCPNCGHEGFSEDFFEERNGGPNVCSSCGERV
jgi:hypothetical protein